MECRKLNLYWTDIFFHNGNDRYILRAIICSNLVSRAYLTKGSDEMVIIVNLN